MTALLQTSLFISLFTLGLYYLSLKGWVLYFYRRFIYAMFDVFYIESSDETVYPNDFTKGLMKVLINCPPCMCSFYGLIISIVLAWSGFIIISINVFIFYSIAIFLASAINRIITQMI